MSYSNAHEKSIEELSKQFKGKKFGELVLRHVKKQSKSKILNAMQGLMNLLLQKTDRVEIEKIIDTYNAQAYSKVFWIEDCGDKLINISKDAKKIFTKYDIEPTDEDLINIFNIIVLNYAYSTKLQNQMKKYIKSAIKDKKLKKGLRKNNISNNYRWSILFEKDGIPKYEMLGDNVIRMLGHFIITFSENQNPINPWKLILKHNKKGEEIELRKKHFPNSDDLNCELVRKIETIDPDYQVTSYKEEVFIDKDSGEYIPISSHTTSSYEDYIKKLENREINEDKKTFFDILESIF